MLQQFLALDGGTDEAIREFAQQWGLFGLCRHGLPHHHNHPTGTMRLGCQPQRAESLKRWRKVIKKFHALHNLAAELRWNEKGSAEDWALVWGWEEPPEPKSKRLHLLTSEINNQLYLGRVQPRLEYRHGSFAVVYGFAGWTNLYGALALQLLQAAAGTEGFGHCDGCGEPFAITGRAPSPGRRAYCLRCQRLGVPHRDAQRDLRRRQREARP